MQKIIWPVVAVVVVGAFVGFVVLKNNTRYRPEAIPRGVPRDVSHEELHEIFLETREATSPSPREGSCVVVEQTTLELGELEPDAKGEHVFTIRNEGTQTLVLGDIEAEGMAAALRERQVQPGGQTELKVVWTAPPTTSPFQAKAKVPTSDPDKPELHFRVQGHVLKHWEVEDNTVAFGSIDPRKTPGVRSTLIYSPVWEEFEITDVTCSNDEIGAWKIQPADADELGRFKAKSGYRLEITMPPGLPSGGHEASLVVTLQSPVEDAKPIHTEIRFGCRVLRRLCVYGDEIDEAGLVNFGIVSRGRGKSVTLRVKMRDEEPDLPNVRLDVEPSFLQTEFKPAVGAPGLYSLKITVPPDAPICTHMLPQQHGTLRIQTDHPRGKEQTLLLRFAVSDGLSSSL